MKICFKDIHRRYFDSLWLPGILFIIIAGLFALEVVPNRISLPLLEDVLLIMLGASILGIFVSAIWNLAKKRWNKGIINLILVLVSIFGFHYTIAPHISNTLIWSSEDGFADHLIIPENIDISDPQGWGEASRGGPEDTYQTSLLDVLEKPGNEDPSVTAQISSLLQLHRNAPDILRRYLASCASWRVFEEHGALFATRRWMIGSKWRYTLHGYYGDHNIDKWGVAGLPQFQTRFTLGLSGKAYGRMWDRTTRINPEQTMHLKLTVENQRKYSHCVIKAENLVVEIIDVSETKERRLTKATLTYLNDEMRPLISVPEWTTIRSIVPSDSFKKGEPSIELYNSFQPGIYDSVIWINPGEPGMIYLKAYEVTRNHRLSADRLKEYSNEWVGWSEDPKELFFSNTHFTIYEGDWGKPYAARFEVWFVPESKSPERKLIDKVFKIEGWQR